MARGFIQKNNLTKETLMKLVLIGVVVIAAGASPILFNEIAKTIFKEKLRRMAYRRARKLQELKKRKLIEFKEMPDGSVKITLSHLGKKLVRRYKLEEMLIQKPKKWDKKWRVVIYDIPHSQRKASEAFRKKLKNLGLYRLQKSIWISPYECLPEIEFICSVFEINMDNCVYYFKTDEVPKIEEVKKFFSL